MRTVKDPAERKNEILEAANALFSQKGYDATTISDIIEAVGVARGTVYYYFKSKEDIMDALIESATTKLLQRAKQIADDKTIPVFERMFQTLLSMNIENEGGTEMTKHMHKPQNALLHEKTREALIKGIPPILTDIVNDGIKEGLIETPYPYESVELIIAYVNTVFDNYSDHFPIEEMEKRVMAFIFNLERLFGTKPGSFAFVAELF